MQTIQETHRHGITVPRFLLRPFIFAGSVLHNCRLVAFLALMHLTLVALISCGLVEFACAGQSNFVQENDADAVQRNWRLERIRLEHQFGEELVEIADWCRQNGIPQQVEPTFQLKIKRDPNRQYIFPPTTKTMPQPQPEVQGEVHSQWLAKVNQARRNHAARIFELAREAADASVGGTAYQLLHEVIYYDRDHEETRKMLRHVKRNDQWRTGSDAINVSLAPKAHELFGWPERSYLKVSSQHFLIESTANQQRTELLAMKLERCHEVWRQVFFEYWASETWPQKMFNGRPLGLPKKKFHVVFFKDKADYVASLQVRVPGIAASDGYYSNTEKISFFADGGALQQDSWEHELTHQLFRESEKTRPDAFEEGYFWLDEGVASYFESLTDHGGYFTLGGFDSRRLQYARLRRLLENYSVPLKEVSQIGRGAFQGRADTELLYSQSAGIVDMLMNADNGRREKALIKFLDLVYKRQPRGNSFEKLFEATFEELDQKYLEHLKVDTETVENFLLRPEMQDVLSVSHANLGVGAFDEIGRCINLQWLDLSGNIITRDRLKRLKDCDKITQLFLTECRIESEALLGLSVMDNLQEVDLSGSGVRDENIAELASCDSLISLQLVATQITDQGVAHLADIPNLRTVNLTMAKNVSNQALVSLKAKRPALVITR